MAQVTFDFTGQTPVEGGGQNDYFPPGRYRFKLERFEDGASSSAKRMVTVGLTTADNRHLTDRFVLSTDFGVRRLMGFLVALGVKVPAQSVSFDTDKILGRECEADIGDDKIPASAEYPNERTVSRVTKYHFPPEIAAAMGVAPTPAQAQIAAPAAPPPVPQAPPPPPPAPAEVPQAPPPPPPPAPPAPEAVAAPVAVAAAPVAAPANVDLSAGLDDLFGS